MSDRIELPTDDVVGIRASNPGPFTLGGTNSWIVGRDPAWLVDPGPALDDHVKALTEELHARGGLGGIAQGLTVVGRETALLALTMGTGNVARGMTFLGQAAVAGEVGQATRWGATAAQVGFAARAWSRRRPMPRARPTKAASANACWAKRPT